jgi:hypothetical protein
VTCTKAESGGRLLGAANRFLIGLDGSLIDIEKLENHVRTTVEI